MHYLDWNYGTGTYSRLLSGNGYITLPQQWAEIAENKGLWLVLRRLPEAKDVYYIQGIDEIGFDSLRLIYKLNGVLVTTRDWKWFYSSAVERNIRTNRSVRIPDSFLEAARMKKGSHIAATGRTNSFLIYKSDPSLEERLQKELRQEWLASVSAYEIFRLRQPCFRIS